MLNQGPDRAATPRRARLDDMTAAQDVQARKKVTPAAAARILSSATPSSPGCWPRPARPSFSRPTESHFATLVRAVVYQQLAGRAAAAIHGRLIAAVGGDVQPEPLLALLDEDLRPSGFPGPRSRHCGTWRPRCWTARCCSPPRLARESDEDIIARLSTVRGIGRWTSEMFLLFQLRRLDVWPVGDLGVRHGYGLAWQVPTPTAKELQPLGDPYRPYRSVLAWYCWRAAELYGKAAASAVTR